MAGAGREATGRKPRGGCVRDRITRPQTPVGCAGKQGCTGHQHGISPCKGHLQGNSVALRPISPAGCSGRSLLVPRGGVCLPSRFSPTFCDPPGSSVHGILQASVLEWVAISSSRRSSQASNPHLLPLLYCHVGSLTLMPPGKPWWRGA